MNNAQSMLYLILLSGILGMIGQGIRVVVGLKKMHEAANAQQTTVSDIFQGNRLSISLMIGFIAGALAAFTLKLKIDGNFYDSPILPTLIAAGYSGTDFIEGFMRKSVPQLANDKDKDTDKGKSKDSNENEGGDKK